MRTFMLAALAAGAALVATAPANAAQGCGPGAHRGAWGHCRPNGPGWVAPGAPVGPGGFVINRFYPGRGYWDGHRWWWHRHHWHGGWRYY